MWKFCLRDCKIFLLDMSLKFMLNESSIFCFADFFSLVARKRINHYNIIGNIFHRVQTSSDVFFFVESDYNNRELNHESKVNFLPLNMSEMKSLVQKFESGDVKALARVISIVENETAGYEEILSSLKIKNVPVVGITGPPGAGKSTLINAILKKLTDKGKRVGVIAIDPTSPFNYGSLLGDRLRMAEHFTNEKVFIRSLATRGSLGGLSAKTIEVSDVLRAFGFDYVFIETVGVGQSEVEIAGLADTTVLVLVPG